MDLFCETCQKQHERIRSHIDSQEVCVLQVKSSGENQVSLKVIQNIYVVPSAGVQQDDFYNLKANVG